MNIERLMFIDNRVSRLNLFILRTYCQEDLTPEDCKAAMISYFRRQNEREAHRGRDIIETSIDTLETSPIVYWKKDRTFNIEENKEYYYTQVVLDMAQSRVSTGDTIRNIGSYLSGLGYQPDWITGETPMNMYFSISAVEYPDRTQVLRFGPNQPALQSSVRKAFGFKNNISFKIDFKNPDQSMKMGTPFKMNISIYEDITKALMSKSSSTLCVGNYDGIAGLMMFGRFRDGGNNLFTYKYQYEEKIKAQFIGETLVIYDGEKSFECVRPYIPLWSQNRINLVDILQFSHHKDLYFEDGLRNNYIRKLVLHFVSQDKIVPGRSRLKYDARSAFGTVCFMPDKTNKPKHVDIVCRNSNGYIGEFVIPVNNDNVQVAAMKLVSDYIMAVTTNDNTNPDHAAFIAEYINYVFKREDAIEDDILSAWFKNCVKTNKRTERGIIYAYMNMKDKLEQEYNGLKTYVECFDFSKCKPVPSVEMDKKLKENFYKTLHIQPENIIINKINNKKINQISQMKSTVTFSFMDSRDILRRKSMPIYDFYENTTNKLKFDFNKMKGMVARDKVKNR